MNDSFNWFTDEDSVADDASYIADDETSYFLPHIKIALAIAILQLQVDYRKRGKNYTISELCKILKEPKTNWKLKCKQLEKQVLALQTELSLSKGFTDFEEFENVSPQFSEENIASSFLVLQNLSFSKPLSSTPENISQHFVVAINFLEEALSNSYWPENFLKICSQTVGKAYPNLSRHESSNMETQFINFVKSILNGITNRTSLNQDSHINRSVMVLTNVIADCNSRKAETTLILLLEETEKKFQTFITKHNSSDFEIIHYLLHTVNSLIKKLRRNSVENRTDSFLIFVLNTIHRIYELSLQWPLVSYKVWRLIEIILPKINFNELRYLK